MPRGAGPVAFSSLANAGHEEAADRDAPITRMGSWNCDAARRALSGGARRGCASGPPRFAGAEGCSWASRGGWDLHTTIPFYVLTSPLLSLAELMRLDSVTSKMNRLRKAIFTHEINTLLEAMCLCSLVKSWIAANSIGPESCKTSLRTTKKS